MDVKAKFEQIGQRILGSLEKIFISCLALALLGVGYLYMTESGATTPEAKTPQLVKPEAKIVISKDPGDQRTWSYLAVMEMATQRKEIEETDFEKIIRFNPFDPKEVRDNEALKDQAGQIINTARQLRERGDLPRALEEVNKALELLPKYQPALQLKSEIEADIQKAEQEKAKAAQTAGAKPPAAAGTPGS